ncbi:2Fe-2S iron-sulfur cluster-binding protein [Zavarzinia sp. CC-PAN008]|uniref:2Fe-2S iron-sulfur cluster-binding protein n=1 Tax=Zavarzinia sp. CC-PAN008 TaxID=3243332 RepID=UPI003F747C0C
MARITIMVTDRAGEQVAVEAPLHLTLMEVLKDNDLDVEAVCGGAMACATCHVWIDPDWSARVGPATGGELALVSSTDHHRPGSRLSCQVSLDATLDGLTLTVAPPD